MRPGGRQDEPRILELLRHEDVSIRRASLVAIRWIASDATLVEIASASLHDESDLVVRAAARLLKQRVSRIPKSVIDAAVASDSRPTRLAGLRLARRSDGWSRLEADLMLVTDADEVVANEGVADLGSWVGSVAPSLYGAPPPDQLASIGRLLELAGLETSLDRAIRFHAEHRSPALRESHRCRSAAPALSPFGRGAVERADQC